jgi:SWI/SNF-related matrix-associated actin-dependent regulator of chromatin subfamily A member 5
MEATRPDRESRMSLETDDSANDNGDSDVEYDGMDVDDGVDDAEEKAGSNDLEDTYNDDDDDDEGGDDDVDQEIEALADEEAKDLEEARRERMELMAAEQAKMSLENNKATTPQERLEYLIAQSEAFAHFLAGSVATNDRKGKKGSRGKKGRLSEAEEDAQLLKSALSKRKVVRLEKQPSNLSQECKMHAYQLEGLNWMLRLHDNGINGILADEVRI